MERKETEQELRDRVANNIGKKFFYTFIICSSISILMFYILGFHYLEELKGGNFTSVYWILFFIAAGIIIVPAIIGGIYTTYYLVKLNLIPAYRQLWKQYRKKE